MTVFDDLADAFPVEGGVGNPLDDALAAVGAVGMRLEAVFAFVDEEGAGLGHDVPDVADVPRLLLFSRIAARRRMGHESTVVRRPPLRGGLGVGVFDFEVLADGVFVFAGDGRVGTVARTRGAFTSDASPPRFFAGSTARFPRVMTAPRATFPLARFTRSASLTSFALPIARRADVRFPIAARVPAAAPALPRAFAPALCRAIAFLRSAFFSLLTPFIPLSRASISRFLTVGDLAIRRVLRYYLLQKFIRTNRCNFFVR